MSELRISPSNTGVIQRMSVMGVDAKTTGATTIGTTEAGRRFYPLFAVFNCATADTVSVVASLSLGTNSTDFNDILAITAITGVSAVNASFKVDIGTTALSSVAPSTAIKVKITTGATATTNTIDVHLFGFYI